jgi:hypothetical protein
MNGAPMEVLEISTSGAIAKLSFNDEDNTVGVAYTYKPDKFYVFKCDSIDGFKDRLHTAFDNGESVGKMISQMKKDGVLVTV